MTRTTRIEQGISASTSVSEHLLGLGPNESSSRGLDSTSLDQKIQNLAGLDSKYRANIVHPHSAHGRISRNSLSDNTLREHQKRRVDTPDPMGHGECCRKWTHFSPSTAYQTCKCFSLNDLRNGAMIGRDVVIEQQIAAFTRSHWSSSTGR